MPDGDWEAEETVKIWGGTENEDRLRSDYGGGMGLGNRGWERGVRRE